MSKSFSGPKGSLKLNGVKVAFVGGVNVTQDDPVTRIDVIDQLQSAELAETGHTCSFTCDLFKIDGNSLIQLGIRTSNLDDILAQPELTMEIFNRDGDRVEYTMSGVKWVGGTGSLQARDVWRGTWRFEGIKGSGF